MFNSELHHRYTLERLEDLRQQAALKRQFIKSPLRHRLAVFLHSLASKLEGLEARGELQQAQI